MSTYRILITGTRNELMSEQRLMVTMRVGHLVALAERADPQRNVVIVHGACPSGVDELVDHLAFVEWGLDVERHPARWDAPCDETCFHRPTPGRCPAAGPRRNREMVEAGADICLAFPMGASRGTRGCIALAQAAGIPTTVVEL